MATSKVKIYQTVFSDKNRIRFEVQRLAQDRVEFFEDGKVAFTYISKEDEDALGSKNGYICICVICNRLNICKY